MDLAVDHAGQDMQPRRLERLGGGGSSDGAQPRDAAAANADIPPPAPVLVDDRAATYQEIKIRGHGIFPDVAGQAKQA